VRGRVIEASEAAFGRGVRLGLCAPIGSAIIASAAGFDYLECPLTSLFLPSGEPAPGFDDVPLPIEAFNIFLPADLAITGPRRASESELAVYAQRHLSRAHAVGAEVVVLGSGRSRTYPDGYPRHSAERELLAFLTSAGRIAHDLGLVVALEPLRRAESNLVNSVEEAVALVAQADCDAIQVLADLFHMEEEHEPLENVLRHADRLAHVHVADTGRFAPGTGTFPLRPFAALLREAGYRGRVSVECNWRDLASEGADAVRFLRSTFADG
jgi:sugar phosphate isomerase/epimerase